MRKSVKLGVVLLVAWFTFGLVKDIETTAYRFEVKEIEIQDTNAELKQLELEYKSLNQQLNKAKKSKTSSQKEINRLKRLKTRLESDKQRLRQKLVSKRNAKKNATYSVVEPVYASSGSVGSCKSWMQQAGVSTNQFDAAYSLIMKESGCDPTVWNKQGSGAGGIPQALPASKMGCPMTYTDSAAICQIKWMIGYVNGRYGGFPGALAFWRSQDPHWY